MSFIEQPARANLLKKMIGAKILNIHDLTAHTLAAMVKDAAGSKEVSSSVPKEWFKGADILEKALTGLFRR